MSDGQKKEEEASNDKNDKGKKVRAPKFQTPDERDKRNARRRELYKVKRDNQKANEKARANIPGAEIFQNISDLGRVPPAEAVLPECSQIRNTKNQTAIVEIFSDNVSEETPKKNKGWTWLLVG